MGHPVLSEKWDKMRCVVNYPSFNKMMKRSNTQNNETGKM